MCYSGKVDFFYNGSSGEIRVGNSYFVYPVSVKRWNIVFIRPRFVRNFLLFLILLKSYLGGWGRVRTFTGNKTGRVV